MTDAVCAQSRMITGTCVICATQRRFGAHASKRGSSRSGGSSAVSSGTVVRGRLRGATTPDKPRSRISRSTVHGATVTPWAFSSSHIFRVAYTCRGFFLHISVILSSSMASRVSRADGNTSRCFAK